MRALCARRRPRRERTLYPHPPGVDELVRADVAHGAALITCRDQRGQVSDEAPRQDAPGRRRVDDQLASRRRLVRPIHVHSRRVPHTPCSHLPDITVITPVFDTDSNEIIFFTASRGHHADIGGILPGSMPPTSVNIFEEGAEIVSFKIVDGGVFDQKGLYEYMVEKPARYPGSSGCRNIRDVESDLKAVRETAYPRSAWLLIRP